MKNQKKKTTKQNATWQKSNASVLNKIKCTLNLCVEVTQYIYKCENQQQQQQKKNSNVDDDDDNDTNSNSSSSSAGSQFEFVFIDFQANVAFVLRDWIYGVAVVESFVVFVIVFACLWTRLHVCVLNAVNNLLFVLYWFGTHNKWLKQNRNKNKNKTSKQANERVFSQVEMHIIIRCLRAYGRWYIQLIDVIDHLITSLSSLLPYDSYTLY